MQKIGYFLYKANCLILILIGWISSVNLQAENAVGGLLFRSNSELIDQRTSLDLFDGEFKSFKDSFSIQFDLSIWDIQAFGYILRLETRNNQEISLVFVNFRGADSLFFDCNDGISNKSIQIPICKEKLNKGSWLTMKLHFDLIQKQIVVSLLGEKYILRGLGLKNPEKLLPIFGLYGTNLDLACMALRNVRITYENNKTIFYPLNESEGNVVHNDKGEAKGSVKNPNWLINTHFLWEKTIEFQAACMAGVSFDKKRHELLVINQDSVEIYNTRTHKHTTQRTEHIPFRITSGEAIFSPVHDKYYLFDFNDWPKDTICPSIAIVNKLEYKQLKIGSAPFSRRLHHQNVFFDENEDSPYVFGGYGQHTYTNVVRKYNDQTDQWVVVPFSGDSIISPRFFSACGKGKNPWEILIFGGFGNESGKQELGGRNLFDLFILDLRAKTTQKLWEIKRPHSLFVPCSNLILDPSGDSFYTLCYPHHIAKTQLQLYRFNLSDGTYKEVGSAIPFLSEKIESEVYLFFDDVLKEFYAVVREYANPSTSNIRIYSLNTPPVERIQLQEYKANQFQTPLVLSLIVIVSIGLFLIWRKNKIFGIQSPFNTNPEDGLGFDTGKNFIFPTSKEFIISEIRKKNSIYVFGDFIAFDKNGMNISHRFSIKLKYLFSLILLHSKGTSPGISTEKLTTCLWPEREPSDAKNIRGVTINHLRRILADFNTINLEYKDSRWFFTIENDFYCDYLEYYILMEKGLANPGNKSEASLNQLLSIVNRGQIFPALQSEWIDVHKQQHEAQLEVILKTFLHFYFVQKKHNKVMEISTALFLVDPFNESALLYAIKSLRRAGKLDQAQNLYNRFSSRFKDVMGENYKHTFVNLSERPIENE